MNQAIDLDALVNEYVKRYDGFRASLQEAGEELLALSPDGQAKVVLMSLHELATHTYSLRCEALKTLASTLLRRKLPFDAVQVESMAATLKREALVASWTYPIGSVLSTIERCIAEHGLSDTLRSRLESVVARSRHDSTESKKAVMRIEKMLARPEESHEFKLTPGEQWTNFLIATLDQQPTASREAWVALLEHGETAKTSKPSKKWLKQADALVQTVSASFVEVVCGTLAKVGQPGEVEKLNSGGFEYTSEPTQVHSTHADLLRGLIWSTSLVKDERLIQAVGDAAEICFKKIPGIGPRSPKIGNACLYALSAWEDLAAVAQLSRLKTKVKHASIRTQLAKSLDAAAEVAGMSQDDLEEVAVPTCGLTELGLLEKPLGDFTAQIRVLDTKKVELRWLKPDGKSQSSIPATIKQSFADDIKAIKAVVKEVEQTLPVQRQRIEQLYLKRRSWRFADWRRRYLDHLLVGTLARRLIWTFDPDGEKVSAIWHQNRLVDVTGRPLDHLTDETRVELWHPINEEADVVRRWRAHLEEHQVRHPFKHAHREVYILTEAERQTDLYSNRFAAHIIRQHQFAALCQQRAWQYTLQGAWDSANTPTVQLPAWQMFAEYWVEALERSEESELGVFRYVSTDQVRFYEIGEAQSMRLADVPPMVFTEVMRDVDLFVGVCSIGNDPTWGQRGQIEPFNAYWHDYSFGELAPTGQSRKEILERLVPRLKIADRCSFSDKFLVVQGDLRTYKIHLGSANILMEPNDQYLCIVPNRKASAAEDVFLPFEGDMTLSVILSKALMLANDTKIKDPTITSQIKPR